LRKAREFFEKDANSYAEYKQQLVSLRMFVFAGVTGSLTLALIINPPKSSYWATYSPGYWWSNIKEFFGGGDKEPVFLSKKAGFEKSGGECWRDVMAKRMGVAAPAAPAAPSAPAMPAQTSSKKVGNFKVTVCGGAGGIGQPLSLLMAMDENVAELNVFDLNIAMVPAEGVAADLSHLEFMSKVKAYTLNKEDKPIDKLEECLSGCDLVLVPAGLPRRPGMTRADLLGVNAGIAKNIVEACARYCPNAMIGLIVNPVNSVVPAMCELYEKKGLDPRRIVGVTTLDVVRANKFVHEITGEPIENIDIPVVGGHAGASILPLFSQDAAGRKVPASKLEALDIRVQNAGTEVVEAKNGKGSATLSMAYAGARLGKAVLKGLNGEETTECAYVKSDVSELPYFSSKVTFGPNGVEKVHGFGQLTPYEAKRLETATAQLKDEIQAGLDYAATTSLQ
jgi:malate dehydrogenase